MEPNKPQSVEIEEAIQQVEAAKSFTAKKDLIEHFGADRYREKPDGGWSIHLKTWKEIHEFDEMDRPRARLETEQAHKAYARIPVVTLLANTGRRWEVPEAIAEQLCNSEMGRALEVRQVPKSRRGALYSADGTRIR